MSTSFSIIIPTHNRLGALRETMAALEDQVEAPPFEVIVVDDGSSDGTAAWLAGASFRLPVQVARREQSGPAAARNEGVRKATGERVAFIGDDTAPQPTWLAAHARVVSDLDDGGASTAVLGYTRWHKRMRVTRFLDYLNEDGQQFGYRLIHGQREVPFNFFYTSNLSLARAQMTAEPFDERFPSAAWEDTECSYRLHQRGLRLVYEPSAVVEHDHPMTLERFCRRQESAGRSAVIFYELHPELGPFLGLGPAGPPGLPARARYRAAYRLACLIDGWPVRAAQLWDFILRYHYIIGLREGWQSRPARGHEGVA